MTQGEYEPLQRLRRSGWSVAVHNDYHIHGRAMTFWLFTHGDLAIKGEGYTDGEALIEAETEAARVVRDKRALLRDVALNGEQTRPSDG